YQFDIVVKAGVPLAAATKDAAEAIRSMLGMVLAERFKLVAHDGKEEVAAYGLVLSRSDRALGPRLHQSTTDCARLTAARRNALETRQPLPQKGAQCGLRVGPGHVSNIGMPLSQFYDFLSRTFFDRMIVDDRTGLTGNVDVDLTWTKRH